MRVCECECVSVRVCECVSVRVCECVSVRVCECGTLRVRSILFFTSESSNVDDLPRGEIGKREFFIDNQLIRIHFII